MIRGVWRHGLIPSGVFMTWQLIYYQDFFIAYVDLNNSLNEYDTVVHLLASFLEYFVMI